MLGSEKNNGQKRHPPEEEERAGPGDWGMHRAPSLGWGVNWETRSLFVMAGGGRLGPRKEQQAMSLNVREPLGSRLLCPAEIPQPDSGLYT